MIYLYFSFILDCYRTALRLSLSTRGSTLVGEAFLTLTTIRFTSSSMWSLFFLPDIFLSLSADIVLEKSTMLFFCWESVGSTGPRASVCASMVYGAVPSGLILMKRLTASGFVEASMLAYCLLLWDTGDSIRDMTFGVSIAWSWSCYCNSATTSDGIDVFGSLNFTSSDWLVILPQGSLLCWVPLKLI